MASDCRPTLEGRRFLRSPSSVVPARYPEIGNRRRPRTPLLRPSSRSDLEVERLGICSRPGGPSQHGSQRQKQDMPGRLPVPSRRYAFAAVRAPSVDAVPPDVVPMAHPPRRCESVLGSPPSSLEGHACAPAARAPLVDTMPSDAVSITHPPRRCVSVLGGPPSSLEAHGRAFGRAFGLPTPVSAPVPVGPPTPAVVVKPRARRATPGAIITSSSHGLRLPPVAFDSIRPPSAAAGAAGAQPMPQLLVDQYIRDTVASGRFRPLGSGRYCEFAPIQQSPRRHDV